MLLAGILSLQICAEATDTLHIGPARALPDYAKASLAEGTGNDDELYPVFALGDFNQDGRLDVAIATGSRPPVAPYAIRVYLQSTDGTLQKKSEFLLPNTDLTWTFFSADFNNDGHLDLLLEDLANDLIMVSGNGDGTFQEPRLLGLSAPAFPVAAHFNNDRHVDLVSGSLEGTVVVFAGAGDGTFAARAVLNTVIHAFQPRSGQIMVGDVNRDGNADVVVASVRDTSTQTGNLDVFLGKGDATFQDVVSTPAVAAWRGALGDFNGDGVLDFAGDRYDPETVEIWLGQGNGHFAKGASYSMEGYSPDVVQVADLNGDSIQDLVVSAELPSGAQAAPLSIFLGKGDGTFQSRQEFTPLPDGLIFNVGPRFGDFNQDGLMDIVSVTGSTTPGQYHKLAVALNSGVKPDPNRGFLVKVQNSVPAAGISIVLEASANLVNWTPLATNVAAVASWSVVFPNIPGQSQHFYRTRQP